MHSQGVARKERIHPPAADQLHESLGGTRVHHHGPGDEDDALAFAACIAQQFDHARDTDLDAPFRADVVRHEGELVFLTRGRFGNHAHTLVADHHRITASQIAQLAAEGLSSQHDNGGIHALASHRLPAATQTHLCAVIGRGIELQRCTTIAATDFDPRIRFALQTAAQRHQLLDKRTQLALTLGIQAQAHTRRLLGGLADGELDHFVGAATLKDFVKNP